MFVSIGWLSILQALATDVSWFYAFLATWAAMSFVLAAEAQHMPSDMVAACYNEDLIFTNG